MTATSSPAEPPESTPTSEIARCGCMVGGVHEYACGLVGHVDPPRQQVIPPESTLAAVLAAADELEQAADENVPAMYLREREAERRIVKAVRALPVILAATPTAAHVEVEWPADDDDSWRAVAKRWECLYREAVGLPVAEHTARRMEAIASAAESSAAHVAELEAALAAAEARLRAVEALAVEWQRLADAGYIENHGLRFGERAKQLRAALATPPQPAPEETS